MSDPLKICLVGCGRVAKSHLEGMLEIPESVKLEAVVSRSPEKAEQMTARFGKVKVYPTVADALKDPAVEAFDLCLPNHLHPEVAIECLNARKPVIVEKPLANTFTEAESMVAAAEKNRTILMCGQSRRFYDAVMKAREIIASGKIGRPVSMTALLYAYLAAPPTEWWKSVRCAGGLIIPIWGSHILDSALWFFGELPEDVYCRKYRINSNWEGEDEAVIVLGFSGGRHASIEMSWNTKLHPMEKGWDGKGKMLNSKDIRYERRIQCEHGTLMLDDELRLTLDGQEVVSDSAAPGNFARELAEFADAVRTGRQPMASGREILPLIRVMDAAMESAESGQAVKL